MERSDDTQEELKYGTTGDEFKPLDQIILPDVRQQSWGHLKPDGTIRKVQLADLHHRMSGVTVNSSAPQDVRTAFDTARNLFLYSWFVYRFVTVAELQAYAALEFALGRRIEIDKLSEVRGLARRFDLAIKRGWLRAEGIRRCQRSAVARKDYEETHGQLLREYLAAEGAVLNEPNKKTEPEYAFEYLHNLKGSIPKLRNYVAHGEPMLHNGAAVTLEICCDLINQLFP